MTTRIVNAGKQASIDVIGIGLVSTGAALIGIGKYMEGLAIAIVGGGLIYLKYVTRNYD